MAYAAYCGLFDSLRGIIVVFYLDNEINQKLKARLSPTRAGGVRKGTANDKTPTRTLKDYEYVHIGS